MISKILACIVSTILIFIVAGSFVWAGETYVQDNGISCKSTPDQFGRFSRNQRGITNISHALARLYCPITPPAFDSDPSTELEVHWGEVYVSASPTGAWPGCRIYAMTKTGSAFWSAPGTVEFDWYSGSNITKFPSFKHPDSRAISIGYRCDVPSGASIHGSITRMYIGRIHGGI